MLAPGSPVHLRGLPRVRAGEQLWSPPAQGAVVGWGLSTQAETTQCVTGAILPVTLGHELAA